MKESMFYFLSPFSVEPLYRGEFLFLYSIKINIRQKETKVIVNITTV